MTVYRSTAGGTRFRGVGSQSFIDSVPWEARDQDDPTVVHWSSPPGSQDPFLDGAYWALGWSTSLIFGDLLGPLFNDQVVSDVQRWTGTGWEPLA